MNIEQGFNVTLTRIRSLSSSTMDFRFVRDDGRSLAYKPGQFYRFTFTDDAGEFERSYSLCNFDELYGDKLELVISAVEGGRATALLFNAAEGLTASVSGPYGRLVLPEQLPRRLVMVATSVGIAPYIPILHQLQEPLEKQAVEVQFLFGTRDRTEFIYHELFEDFMQRFPGFHLHMCYSREASAEADHEHIGYVTSLIEELQPDTEHDHYLLCGNPRMIDDLWGDLKARGFRHKQVVREKYEFARRETTKKTEGPSDEQKRLIAEKMAQFKKNQ